MNRIQKITLVLHRVLYVPGLNRRLFSIPAFVRNAKYSATFSDNTTRFHFGDGQTLEIPLVRKQNNTLQGSSSAFPTITRNQTQDKTQEENTEETSETENDLSNETQEKYKTSGTTKKEKSTLNQNPLPTLSLERGHKILGHRSIRSLISGSLHKF